MTTLPRTQMALDPITHDLVFDAETHSISRVGGSEGIRQALKSRLLLVRNEWFLALSNGIPWFTEMTGRTVHVEKVRSYITGEILKTWGVEELITLEILHDKRTRRLEIYFTYRDIYQSILEVRL